MAHREHGEDASWTKPTFARWRPSALVLGSLLALACGPPLNPIPKGAVDASIQDALGDEAAPVISCARYGGTCTSVPTKSCPVQITGTGLCEGDLICCTGQ
jgi:hypothetical protein